MEDAAVQSPLEENIGNLEGAFRFFCPGMPREALSYVVRAARRSQELEEEIRRLRRVMTETAIDCMKGQ